MGKLILTLLFAFVQSCRTSTSEFLDFHNKNVNVTFSEIVGFNPNVLSNATSNCGAQLNSTKSMGFLLNQSYLGDLDVEMTYSCYTLPQPNAYQSILYLILAGPGYTFSSQNQGALGQLSVKMHSAIDNTWFQFNNKTYTQNANIAPRMPDGKLRLERRGSVIKTYYWRSGSWVKLNNFGSAPAILPGPLRVGVFIDLYWTSSYSIGLGSLLILPDTDGDGILDDIEALIGTDPARADTDQDGLADADDPRPLDPAVAFEVLVAAAPPWNSSTGAAAAAAAAAARPENSSDAGRGSLRAGCETKDTPTPMQQRPQ
jgi:hypothetical protein